MTTISSTSAEIAATIFALLMRPISDWLSRTCYVDGAGALFISVCSEAFRERFAGKYCDQRIYFESCSMVAAKIGYERHSSWAALEWCQQNLLRLLFGRQIFPEIIARQFAFGRWYRSRDIIIGIHITSCSDAFRRKILQKSWLRRFRWWGISISRDSDHSCTWTSV